jgi:hypothetical protein
VWSVWSETVDVYLGQGVAMVKTGSEKARVLQHPATMPLQRVLAQLAQAMVAMPLSQKQEQKNQHKHRKVRITLSGALCPATVFSAPPTVTRWQELRQIATASAAAMLGTGADSIVCETHRAAHPLHSGVVATVNAALMAELHAWAGAHRLRITSLRPLWAVASSSAMVQQPTCGGLLLHEPDSLTVLASGAAGAATHTTGEPVAATLVGGADPSAASAALWSTTTRRWLVGLGLAEDALLKLTFSTQAGMRLPRGPKPWAAHWSTSKGSA